MGVHEVKYPKMQALRQVSATVARHRKFRAPRVKKVPLGVAFRLWASTSIPFLTNYFLTRKLVGAIERILRGIGSLKSKVSNAFNGVAIRFAMTLYRIFYKRRHHVKAGTGELSDFLDEFQNSINGRRLLQLTFFLSVNWIPILSSLYFWSLQNVFVGAVGVHLAAGQNVRALMVARIMNFLFRPAIRSMNGNAVRVYFEALRRSNMFARIVREVPEFVAIDDFYLNRILGTGHLHALRTVTAKKFFERALEIHSSYYEHLMIGRAQLIELNFEDAVESFDAASKIFPPCVMSHQNYAGRYDIASYRPEKWELESAGRLMVYDNLAQFAEEQFLYGNLTVSLHVYQMMLNYQDELAQTIDIPKRVRYFFKADYDEFDLEKPVRILSYEWVIQFGHIGLLSAVVKMRKLGMMPDANYILLAPEDKTANKDFLNYWSNDFIIVTDPQIVNLLFPYQRSHGENFMVAHASGDMAEPWTRKAARAQIAWARSVNDPLLSLSDDDYKFGEERLAGLGVPQDVWYVGLHVREGGFYAETQGGMSDHRNSHIEDYLDAIDEVVARGGIVIRLGDASMTPLPYKKGVIDYAHSASKSSRMDLFILATCRFLIGTTSGLTTAAHAFGTPSVLVNCISNDWQLWDGGTDFIVKRVYDRQAERYLTLAETYRMPIQGYLMNNSVLERYGYSVHANSSADILMAVRFKLDIELGLRTHDHIADAEILARYEHTLKGNAFMFGAARPVPDFLREHSELLGEPAMGAYPNQQWSDECAFDVEHQKSGVFLGGGSSYDLS